jgi:hypothetical protein
MLVLGENGKLFAVDITLANIPPSRIAPTSGGSPSLAVVGRISRGFSSLNALEPITARMTSKASSSSAPAIQPNTASLASRSERADKNFWYMP